jgi:hypothetical protein
MELADLGWKQQKLVERMADAEQATVLWDGWPSGVPYDIRLRAAQIVWNLKESGPLHNPDLAAMAKGYGCTRIALSQLLQRLAGIGREGSAKYPHLIERVARDKRTRYLAVRDDVALPPNPFPQVSPVALTEARTQAIAQARLRALEEPVAAADAVVAPIQPAGEDESPQPVLSPADKAILIMRLAGEIFRDVDTGPATVADESFVTAMRAKVEDLRAEVADLRAQLDEERRLRREAVETATAHKRSYEALRKTNSRLDENLRAILNGEPAPDNRDARMFRQLMEGKS